MLKLHSHIVSDAKIPELKFQLDNSLRDEFKRATGSERWVGSDEWIAVAFGDGWTNYVSQILGKHKENGFPVLGDITIRVWDVKNE